MAEYINRNKLVENLEQFAPEHLTPLIRTLIEKQPAADVEEVKHGEWIQGWELEKGFEDNDEIPYIKCSLCGKTEWHIDKERNTTPNYCSDCGAKMDGGKAE